MRSGSTAVCYLKSWSSCAHSVWARGQFSLRDLVCDVSDAQSRDPVMLNNGAGWLQLTPEGTPHNPPEFVQELLPPSFGLHLFDGNIALGNTVPMVALQAQEYLFENEV